MPGPAPRCSCGQCRLCRNRLAARHRTKLPTTFEEAAELRKHSAGLMLWPPVTESIKTLEEKFPHLRNTSILE